MAGCCKINLGIVGSTDCDRKRVSGAIDLRIANYCCISSLVQTPCPDCVVQDIIMDNPDPLNPDCFFYKFDHKPKTLGHTFEHTFDPETCTVVMTETVTVEIDTKDPAAFCAIDGLLQKEVVIMMKEAGKDGRWLMTGIGGNLFLTSASGGTGVAQADNSNTVLTFEGEVNERWKYIFITDDVTTDALVDSVTFNP